MSLSELVAASGQKQTRQSRPVFSRRSQFSFAGRLRKCPALFREGRRIRQQLRRGLGADRILQRKAWAPRRGDRGFEKSSQPPAVGRIVFQYRPRKLLSEAVSRSREAYRQAIRLDPYNAADAYYALGLVYRDWGQPDDEIQAYKQAIKLRPDYTSAYERLGSRYFRSKKYPEAIEVFKQLASLKPGDAVPPNSLGEAYLEMNRLPEALENFRQAIRLKPDFGKAYFNLGNAISRWEIATRRSSSTTFCRTSIRIGRRS